MRLDKRQRKLIKELSQKHGITEEQVLEIVKTPSKFIREKTAKINLPEGLSEEEFKKLTYNFNLPKIGKLYANYYNYKNYYNVKNREE